MYAFENENPDGLKTYADALWWTAMTMTTMGSDYFPKTGEGQILCLVLALYAFAVFGYVTATLATFFVGRDAASSDSELIGVDEIKALRIEIALLSEEVKKLHDTRL
jgi:voltage-gated potassium channel